MGNGTHAQWTWQKLSLAIRFFFVGVGVVMVRVRFKMHEYCIQNYFVNQKMVNNTENKIINLLDL